MKKYVLLTAMTLALSIPAHGWSQTSPVVGAPVGGIGVQGEGQNFQAHKSEILQHLSQRLGELQQRQGCVEGAANHQALLACLPPKESHGCK